MASIRKRGQNSYLADGGKTQRTEDLHQGAENRQRQPEDVHQQRDVQAVETLEAQEKPRKVMG